MIEVVQLEIMYPIAQSNLPKLDTLISHHECAYALHEGGGYIHPCTHTQMCTHQAVSAYSFLCSLYLVRLFPVLWLFSLSLTGSHGSLALPNASGHSSLLPKNSQEAVSQLQ